MLRYAAKIIAFQRENGTWQLIRHVFTRLSKALFYYQKEVVGCLSVVDPIPPAITKVLVNIRAAEISDIPGLKVLSTGYKRRDYLRWINDKYIFHVAELSGPGPIDETGSKNRIVGYVCVCPARKSRHKLVSLLNLNDTDYWAVDAYIHPEYRGKGINSAIASGFLSQARKEGYRRGYGTILFNNNASRSSYAHIGEKEIGIFTTITIVGLNFYFLKKNKGYEDFFN